MIESLEFDKTAPGAFACLRAMQLEDLGGRVVDFVEEGIVTRQADFIRIGTKEETAGYVCIGTYEYYKGMILECYLISRYRKYAGETIQRLAKLYGCKKWLVNTRDSLAMPVMLDLGLPCTIDGYQFAVDSAQSVEHRFEQGISLRTTGKDELNEVYDLIMQDAFYTGGGVETVAARLAEEELYSLRQDGRLIGVGFVGILKRTPLYADIAMIIDRNERGKGWGTLLVKALIHESRRRCLIPIAVCGVSNRISRSTLQRAGFYLDGCVLLARME